MALTTVLCSASLARTIAARWVELYHEGGALSVNVLFEAGEVVLGLFLQTVVLFLPLLPFCEELLVEGEAGAAVALAQFFAHNG